MRRYCTLIVAFLALCSCDAVSEPSRVMVTPPNWLVGPTVNPASADGLYIANDGTERGYLVREFTIRSETGDRAVGIHAINFISPDGTVLTDPARSPLFTVERSKVDSRGTRIEGFESLSGNAFINRDDDGDPIVAPLCPVDAAGGCGPDLNERTHNTSFAVRVTYRELTTAQYAALNQSGRKGDGYYFVEWCLSDHVNAVRSDTCTQGYSLRIPIYRTPEAPPAPFVGLQYVDRSPYSGGPIAGYKDFRVIKDPVTMDVLFTCPRKSGADEAHCNRIISDAVVSDDTITAAAFKEECCLPDWKERYCIAYRWELIETPTPLVPETRITIDNIWGGGEGMWYRYCSEEDGDPTVASFKGYKITPTPEGEVYKVKISAYTIDKETDLESEIVEKIDVPNIVPGARVMVQLTWKEGLPTRAGMDRMEGVAVDLDLHLIKKRGMDACATEVGADGLMCTSMKKPKLPALESATHDDCHFNDPGCDGSFYQNADGTFSPACNQCKDGTVVSDIASIAWHASLDIDNRWGGGDYANPETINLGPIDDRNKDGIPDVTPFTDDYLVIVNYGSCRNTVPGGSNDECEMSGSAFNVHARVEIFVDGVKVPRSSKEGRPDDEELTRIDFVIRPQEWIVLDLISWDGALDTGVLPGDAVVKNAPTDYRVCQFDLSYCYDTTIWDVVAYETWVTSDPQWEPYIGAGGECYEYGVRE